ncbi:MAG: LamB/YcsF family protein [marine bacterium B5-7]|nr:MAG: LamB/YcsF family protein [marine bacterium B5-7]
MDQAIVAGKSRGVGMGAHPSYPDLFGFGQNHIDVSDDQLQSILLYQLGALNAILKRHNQELQHVKCHGALYFDISQNEGTCRALLAAIDRIKPTPILVLPSGSKMVSLLRREGIPIAEEIAIDRGYDRSGEMLPRSHPDALITDPKLVADRLIRLLKGGVLRTGLVETAPVQAQTVCLHADTPGATQIGSAVRRVLLMEDIAVRPMAEIIKNQHE